MTEVDEPKTDQGPVEWGNIPKHGLGIRRSDNAEHEIEDKEYYRKKDMNEIFN